MGYRGEPAAASTQALVSDIRALPAPAGVSVLVAGPPAELADQLHSLAAGLPWMLLIMAVVTLVLLFLAFGSVVLPVKAVLVNVLSVGAAFGVLVWGFQYGHLSGLLRFTSTSYLEPTTLVLVLALLFGLATDYEVFLLSRVREEWLRKGDNTAAVAAGLQRTGGLITAAALLLGVVTAGLRQRSARHRQADRRRHEFSGLALERGAVRLTWCRRRAAARPLGTGGCPRRSPRSTGASACRRRRRLPGRGRVQSPWAA